MIKFTSLSMRNFLSYGNNTTVIELERPGTSLIVGEDLDNTTNGQGANGVGKSALINALTYAVYDKPVSNISKDNLVNNINKKNMEVTVEFYGNDGKHYKVHRERKTKAGAAGNNVYFYIDGEDKTRSSAETNKAIEDVVGIPYELFVRIVVFSAAHTPFLDLPQTSHYAANQKDIIEELFGLTQVSEKAKLLKDIIKETEGRLQIRQITITQLEKEHARHQQQIDSARRRVESWQEQNVDTIEQLQRKLAKLDKVDIDQQRSLHAELDEVNGALQDALSQQRAAERALKTLVKDHTKCESELTHLRDAKCPYCLQEYADAQNKIQQIAADCDQQFARIDVLSQELKVVNAAVTTFTTAYKNIKAKITVDNIDELLQIKNEAENIKIKIKELQTAVNPYTEPLEEILAAKLDEISYNEVNKITKEVEHQKFLLKLLTKNDSFVRKALLNKNIPYLNNRLQHYLTFLGLPHQVEFTHEMTASISQFGRELDFGNLSAGQRARVNLALSFAFKDVLQRLHTKINVCMLDEVLDIGLDAVGVQAAARLVKHKARDEGLSMYIISHRDEIDGVFDKTMTVQLSKGFSYIKEEAN